MKDAPPQPYATTVTVVAVDDLPRHAVVVSDPQSWYQTTTGLPGYLEFQIFNAADGSVKWDGCCNWQTNDECMIHACGPDDIAAFSRALAVAYRTCADAIVEDRAAVIP